MTKKYRFVLEFAGDDLETYDRVVYLEERLRAELGTDLINGHDIGQGVVNLFIDTKDTRQCYKKAMIILKVLKEEPTSAGCRKLEEEEYERLWPGDDSTRFELR
jgi:hypothetical protein